LVLARRIAVLLLTNGTGSGSSKQVFFSLFNQFFCMKIYVGNLNYRSTEEEVQQLFSDFGDVKSVQIIKDKMSGRSKGFAFVEMENDAEAKEAIEALNEADFGQRKLVVNEARPMNPDDRRGGDRGGRGQDNRRRY
jgi:RNA recognition motif-containing protein